jgi:hypothetical protein
MQRFDSRHVRVRSEMATSTEVTVGARAAPF